jgi:outer membrane lipoprotein-sorting protein
MIIKHLTLILILLLLCNLVYADKLNDSYQQMLKSYAKLNTWQADINQTNYFAQTKAKLVSSGTFYYQKNTVSIRYQKPNEQALLIKDGMVTVYDKSSKTAVKSQLISAVQSLNPVEIVKTYWQKSEKSFLQSKDGIDTISLKPSKDNQVKELIVSLDSKTGYVTKLVYKDNQDNSVSLAFSKMKVNKPIPATAFKLVLPKDVKLIQR